VTSPQQQTSPKTVVADAPLSTYRLQLHAGFTFEQARAISDYLKQLGVSHAYTSPYLRATPGSTHGYDVIDHSLVNPELGSNDDRARWVESLRTNGLSHVIDVVPNHMGVATSENRWWNDVLEYGPQSDHAGHFDIAWDDPPRAASKGKVLLPILGDRYSKVVRSKDVGLAFDRARGSFSFTLYGRPLPIAPKSYPVLFSKILQLEFDGTVDGVRYDIESGHRSEVQGGRKAGRTDRGEAESVQRVGRAGRPV
jgi:(1->4)-alpha-D-glucan 1-alpha-D-glucosylmutase